MPIERLGGRADRGAVQYAILALLAPRPRHGYDLRDAFEVALGGNWLLNSGQIYSSLVRLGRDGLVAEVGTERGGGPDKRIWELTDAGREEVAAWFASAVPRDYRLRDELYLKLILAVVTSVARPGPILQAQRRHLLRELHDLTARRNALDPRRQLAQILLLDSALAHTEAEIRWLDVVEARLDDIRSQPLPAPPERRRGQSRRRADAVSQPPRTAPPSLPGKPSRPSLRPRIATPE